MVLSRGGQAVGLARAVSGMPRSSPQACQWAASCRGRASVSCARTSPQTRGEGAARARHAVPVGQGQGVRGIGERHRGVPAVPVRAAGPQQGQRGGGGPLGTVQIRREDPRWSPRRQQARRGLVVDVMAWHVRAVPVVSGDVHLADPPVAGSDGVGVQAQPAQRPGWPRGPRWAGAP